MAQIQWVTLCNSTDWQ